MKLDAPTLQQKAEAKRMLRNMAKKQVSRKRGSGGGGSSRQQDSSGCRAIQPRREYRLEVKDIAGTWRCQKDLFGIHMKGQSIINPS
jgi:hypothetical protein